MPQRIHILPDHVANKIAAGEVVERPASVVKELVENALDAGASRVDVELRNGGKTSIRVADDGSGMVRQDALLALDRHATSKIRDAGDLEAVTSYGFRGEALPSIAAVSRFELETAAEDGEVGTRIRVRDGKILSVDEMARQPGTTVTVRSLFHNVPARAKFLKSASAETRAVSRTVVPIALCARRVHVRLVSNDRELLDLPPVERLRERVADVWGREEAAELVPVDLEREGLRVGGLVERPHAARSGRRRRYLFVNGRPFRDEALVAAVDEAYRTTVAPGVRPTFFLYLSVPPDRVDVNVHPTKAEVRFGDRERVEEVVRDAVRHRLGDVESTPGMETGGGAPDRVREAGPAAPGEGVREHHPHAPPDAASRGPAAGTPAAPGAPDPASQLALFVTRGPGDEGEAEGEAEDAVRVEAGPPRLWQLHDTYILAASRDGVLIIDQHAAHERILYEEYMRRFDGESEAASQRLLFPLTLRLSPGEYSAVEELSRLFEKVGFEVEPFGDRTVIVHASPNPHPYFDAERCFRETVTELTEGSELVNSARNQHERIAKSLACKGAIKAGQRLSPDEMTELFDRLFATELPGHDVHGRPTIVRLTLDELARRFRRS